MIRSVGEPDGTGSEVTRNDVSRYRRMSIRGDPDTDRRRYRKCEEKGQPGTFTAGTAEGERIEATRRSITGKAGGMERGAT